MTDSELVKHWQDRLELSGKALRTCQVYGEHVLRLFKWAEGRSIASLSRDDLEQYLIGRKRAGIGESSLGLSVCALKSFYRYIGATVADDLKSPNVKPKLQRTLSEGEVNAVLACIDTSTTEGKRDLAMVGIMLATGLRASEVARLRVVDVDLPKQVFSVVVKGGKVNVRYFDQYAASLIATWLSVRSTVARPSTENLFVSISRDKKRRGDALTREGIKYICKRIANLAGIAHFSPHAMRRTFATLATEFGCPSRLLQDAGGWSSITMLEVYAKAVRLRSFENYSPLVRIMQKPDTTR